MLGAVFKLSYNNIEESPVGGICGSCFFISPDFIITAYHVLNKTNFKPNEGYRFCQYWILSKNFVFEIFPEYFEEYQETDLTLIKNLKKNEEITPYKISKEYVMETECYNEGFMGGDMPNTDDINIAWKENKLVINRCNLEYLKKSSEGKVFFIGKINLDKDVKLKNKEIIGCNYGGHEGMSGGPLLKKDSGEVIGMMCFGLPQNNKIKDKLFAISIEEILEKTTK